MTAVIESVNLGVRFPKETLKKIDRHKGYHSRNRYLCKIVDEYIDRLEKTTGINNGEHQQSANEK